MDTSIPQAKVSVPMKMDTDIRKPFRVDILFGSQFWYNVLILFRTERMGIMSAKLLSPDEIAYLRANPNVLDVISGKVYFTASFKKLAYLQLQEGRRMPDILWENGIDPQVLGDHRIWAFTHALRVHGGENDFQDTRAYNRCAPPADPAERSMAERLRQLEHELAYTRQEVEFLKKIQQADMEARKSWESRQRRK